jgi:hypothetical protein
MTTFPLLVAFDINSNNVASIWLLHGSAGAVIVRNCDDAATTPICSKRRRSLPGKPTVFRYALVGGCSGPVQGLAEK